MSAVKILAGREQACLPRVTLLRGVTHSSDFKVSLVCSASPMARHSSSVTLHPLRLQRGSAVLPLPCHKMCRHCRFRKNED